MLEEEISNKIDESIKKRVNHLEPSPETKQAISNLTMELKYIKEDIQGIKDSVSKLPTVAQMDLANEKLVERIFNKVQSEYVSKTEFAPIKKVIYGVVGIGGAAVVSAIIYSVLK